MCLLLTVGWSWCSLSMAGGRVQDGLLLGNWKAIVSKEQVIDMRLLVGSAGCGLSYHHGFTNALCRSKAQPNCGGCSLELRSMVLSASTSRTCISAFRGSLELVWVGWSKDVLYGQTVVKLCHETLKLWGWLRLATIPILAFVNSSSLRPIVRDSLGI